MHMTRVAIDDGSPDNLSTPALPSAASVTTATLLAFEPGGPIRVLLPGGKEAVPALSAICLSHDDVGRLVLLAFGLRPGDLPVITGRYGSQADTGALRTRLDGDRLVIQASREIELRCGESSIVLTRAGKVLIRGNYVLSHARGMNRIRGAGVHIN